MTSLPKSASSAIVQRSGRFLLVRRGRPPAANMYAFPGGRAETGETPAQTAIRELEEETGLWGRNPRLFATYDLAPEGAGPHFFLSVFLVDVDQHQEAIADDDAAALGWYTPDEMEALSMPATVRACVSRLVSQRSKA